MPSRAARASSKSNPSRSLSDEVEENYAQLVMLLRNTQGMFALLPVRSNYSASDRDDLLRRLEGDLGDIPLRILRLNRESWDPGPMIDEVADTLDRRGAVVLLGLEDTPGIVPAVGEENRRPPALAILNHAREAIRTRCRYPLVVWCDPLTYRALREHAPDFFDYFTGLFTFEGPKDVEADGGRVIHLQVSSGLDLSADVPSILKAGSRAAISFYEERLAISQEPTSERARDLLGLAEHLWACADEDIVSRLDRAAQTATQALSIISKNDAPIEWARGQLILGRIYADQVKANMAGTLERAIDCYEAALQIFSETRSPLDWAKALNGLGIALANLKTGDRVKNFRRAIVCFEGVSRVWSEVDFPNDWAATQVNLGDVYLMLSAWNPLEDSRRAIAYFESALRVYRVADFPREWAMTQHNLGIAYSSLAPGFLENLRRAIACFEAALQVLTVDTHPDDWASTQMNLGIAFAKLAVADWASNLPRAIACFEAALCVWTESKSPQDRMMAQHNLTIARQELARLQSAPKYEPSIT